MVDHKQFKAQLGTRVRNRRESSGLSQEGLAKLCGEPVSSISHIECGRRLPVAPTIIKLADALEMSISALVTGEYDDYARGYAAAVANMAAHVKGMKS